MWQYKCEQFSVNDKTPFNKNNSVKCSFIMTEGSHSYRCTSTGFTSNTEQVPKHLAFYTVTSAHHSTIVFFLLHTYVSFRMLLCTLVTTEQNFSKTSKSMFFVILMDFSRNNPRVLYNYSSRSLSYEYCRTLCQD